MVVPAFVAMSRPWLVAWSLSTLIDAPDTPAQQAAADELSLLMRFRADHFDALFDFAGAGDTHANDHAARVGVLTSWPLAMSSSVCAKIARASAYARASSTRS